MSFRQTLDVVCPPALAGIKRRVESSSLATRLIRGTVWSLVGTVLARLLGLATSMLVARMLGRVGLGELGIVQSTVGMFSALAGLGLGLAATKHVAEHRASNPILLGEIVGVLSLTSWVSGGLIALVVLLFSPWLAQHNLAAPQLAPELRTGTLLLLLGVINGVQTGVLSGFEAFKSIARITVVCGLANFPILVCATYCAGLPGAVWGLVGTLALNCWLSFLAVRQEVHAAGIKISHWHWLRQTSLLWAFGIPGMLTGFISGPANWLTSTILVHQPAGYAEMGLLNATNSWFQAVAFLPNVLGQVLLPILSSYVAARDHGRVHRALSVATLANLLIALPIVFFGCVFSRQIMSLYGSGFGEGGVVLVTTMCSAGVLMAQAPVTNQLIASSRMWSYFFAHLGWAAVFLMGTCYLAPTHGALGLALARLIAYTVNGAIVVVLYWSGVRANRLQLAVSGA